MVTTGENCSVAPLQIRDQRILVTGHTGFKGAWLVEWLLRRGAKISGVALPPTPACSLFDVLDLARRIDHSVCDIRDSKTLCQIIQRASPDIIFHLAAQALVRRSYREPALTWETNVAGTINVLEAARALRRRVLVVAITTDKVYANREWEYAYREEDPLGGHDPYSASKAACEIAIASWRASFGASNGVTVVSARAGNVIGAGDYSEDRIVPDCFRAWAAGESALLRNPNSTRPWQHVLEPLSGYMQLAAMCIAGSAEVPTCNFGPGSGGDRNVATLVQALAVLGENRRWIAAPNADWHEARTLSLSIDRARHRLGWQPVLTFSDTVAWTNAGYTIERHGLAALVRRQIDEYEERRCF